MPLFFVLSAAAVLNIGAILQKRVWDAVRFAITGTLSSYEAYLCPKQIVVAFVSDVEHAGVKHVPAFM